MTDHVDTDYLDGPGSSAAPVVEENQEPLAAVGLSAWLDGDIGRVVLRVTTD